MIDTSERNFEESIEQWLLYQHRYYGRHPDNYDRALCLDAEMVIGFIQATQPEEWQKLQAAYRREDAGQALLRRLASEVAARGVLDVLRDGVKDRGVKFRLAYFVPSSGLNPDLQRRYEANHFSVIRQLQFEADGNKSLDMVLFLNGLPIFTVELKNMFKGQTVENAIRQYKLDRDPRQPLFAFGRCLAHFAVDPELVFVTTQLQGLQTSFLPFNTGKFGGAGNEPRAGDFATAYLWQDIWAPWSILNLVQGFIHTVEEDATDAKGKTRRSKRLIFPRYHQLDAVRRLVGHARESGTGHRYLIQHSAGSGKSNSIAWLAHQLSVLHGDDDRRVFDQIIVISDRRVIDRQLQNVVTQFEKTLGVVETIDEKKHASDLLKALRGGKQIIVTTLQKFPVVLQHVAKEAEETGGRASTGVAGSRFAVIIDEAHSSQTGESVRSVKQALSLEEAEADESGEPPSFEDQINAEMESRRWPPNLSVFAFTATPKAKTLELFGWCDEESGQYRPFSLYSMRQAIEEGFILDVLENYTTYKTYFALMKTIEDDPRYQRSKAMALMRRFVELHPHAIDHKTALMVEHFHESVAGKIGGRAKAMIVARSRLHAVRYRLAFDRYLKEQGYPYKALVAFTGTIRDGGLEHTEPNMNGFPVAQTRNTFERPEYRFLIVAEKFQTGFDQPLLHTMYVDKKLGGVHAVQTLSRLNRIYPGKTETMVLDFANTRDDILMAFQPYYEKTTLSEATDPNELYTLERMLGDFHLYTSKEVDRFAHLYFDPKANQAQLHSALEPIVDRYEDADEESQGAFRKSLVDYTRLYAFLSQVISFTDADLEKLYVFGRLLLRKLPVRREELPVEIQRNIEIDFYRIQRTGSGRIALPRGGAQLPPAHVYPPQPDAADEEEILSKLIQRLNEKFGTDFTEADKVFLSDLEKRLATSETIRRSAEVNTRDNTRLTFDNVARDQVQEMMDVNFKFYKRIVDDEEFAEDLFGWLFDRYWKAAA